MTPASNSETKESIEFIRREILSLSEKWYEYLRQREEGEYTVKKGWVFLFAAAIAYGLIFQFSSSLISSMLDADSLLPPVRWFWVYLLPTIIAMSVFTPIILYLTKRIRRSMQRTRYSGLVDALTCLKSIGEGENLSESILHLINNMIRILPEVKRKETDDINIVAIMGIWIAFPTILIFIGTLFKHIPLEITLPYFIPLCVVICISLGVWFYLRHKVMAEYKQEVSRLEEFHRKFEQQKEEFIKSL
jgi:hypothetical protein